jgi:hypothetical protein
MASKQLKSREEQSAAIAREIAELNGEIERLKYSLEHTEGKESTVGEPTNAALRMSIAPSRASST